MTQSEELNISTPHDKLDFDRNQEIVIIEQNKNQTLPNDKSPGKLKKVTSAQNIIKQGNAFIKYTDKRSPLERQEADRLLNSHLRKLGEIKTTTSIGPMQ